MYYRDVYKRPVNVGDIVLCIPARCSNGVSETQYLIIAEVGNETEPVKVINNEVYCYKLEDTVLRSYARQFSFDEWIDRYDGLDTSFSGTYEGTIHTSMVEMCGRQVKAGDLVVYGLKKTKVNYGIVVSENKILTETGKIVKQSSCLLLENLTQQEQKVKAELQIKYNEYVKASVGLAQSGGSKVKSVSDMQVGDVYITEDMKALYVNIGECGYTVTFDDIGTSTSPYYDELYIKISMSTKCGKQLKQALEANQRVSLAQLIPYFSLEKSENKCYITSWDTGFGQRHGNGVGRCMYFSSFIDFVFLPATDGAKVAFIKGDRVKFKGGLISIGKLELGKHVELCNTDEIRVILNLK